MDVKVCVKGCTDDSVGEEWNGICSGRGRAWL